LWYFHRAKFRSTHRAKYFCPFSWKCFIMKFSQYQGLMIDWIDHSNGIRNVLYSMHCHGIGNRMTFTIRSVCRNFIGYHTVFTSFIGQAKVFFGWHSTTLRIRTNQSLRSDGRGNVVVTRSDICS
jgi:hypothetical protein